MGRPAIIPCEMFAKIRRPFALLWEFAVQPLSTVGRVGSGLLALVGVVVPFAVGQVGWPWSISLLSVLLLVFALMALDRLGAVAAPEADFLCRRFVEWSVDFDNPSKYDLGTYRTDEAWNKKYERFVEALSGLESSCAMSSSYRCREYLDICSEIRDIFSAPVQEPIGRGHYLRLRGAGAMRQMAQLVVKSGGKDWTNRV